MRIGQTRTSHAYPTPRTGRRAQIRLLPGAVQTAWTTVIATNLRPGDRVLVIGAGAIPTLWARIAGQAGLVVEVMETPCEAALARHLGADRFGAIKAVFATPADPGFGATPAAIRRALDDAFHDAALFVDASAAPDPDLRGCLADIILSDPDAGLANLAARPVLAAE